MVEQVRKLTELPHLTKRFLYKFGQQEGYFEVTFVRDAASMPQYANMARIRLQQNIPNKFHVALEYIDAARVENEEVLLEEMHVFKDLSKAFFGDHSDTFDAVFGQVMIHIIIQITNMNRFDQQDGH